MTDSTSASGINYSDAKPLETSIEELAHRLNPYSPYYKTIKDKSPRFAILLGAGASIESGIIGAKTMIEHFVDSLCRIKCSHITNDLDRDKWLRANDYYDEDEKTKYGRLFEKCYPTEVERREYIESIIDKKDPDLGYIALAHLIKREIIDTIITTNFDDLVYQACARFTDIRPTVFSLGGFASDISSIIKHPRILKIHGDYMFSSILKNTNDEVANQDPNMSKEVCQILNDYRGLIVIGYEGNDNSIIELLETIPDKKYLFWCVYKDAPINPKIENLLSKPHRFIVRTNGFRDLMMEICKIANIEYSEIVSSSSHIMKDICEKFTNSGLKKDDIISSEEQQQKKSLDRQLSKVEKSFSVIEYFILGNKAYFNKNYNEAERFYLEAINTKPNEADAHYNYAKVLSENPLNFKKAEEEFKKTIILNEKDVSAHNRYANLLAKDKTREQDAAEYYRKAIDLDPDYFFAHYEYGNFLAKNKLLYGKAENQYREAIRTKSDSAEAYYKLGILLLDDQSRRNETINLFEKAIELKPDFAAAYHHLDKLLRDDEKALKNLDIRNKYIQYKESFFEFFLESAIKAKAAGNKEDTDEYGIKAEGIVNEYGGNKFYKFAQVYAVLDMVDKAIENLENAVNEDFSKKESAKYDAAFILLQNQAKFKKIVDV